MSEKMTGAELRTWRESAGLSREALAERVNVQPRTIKHWESGRADVPDDVASVVYDLAGWVRTEAQKMRLDAASMRMGAKPF